MSTIHSALVCVLVSVVFTAGADLSDTANKPNRALDINDSRKAVLIYAVNTLLERAWFETEASASEVHHSLYKLL